MKLDAGIVGTVLKPYQTEIHWRATTNYAAAIEDYNSKYFDDREKQGLFSHPMFPVSVTWPVLSNLGKFIESSKFPEEVLLTQVHYSEHLVLHRLVRPDDKLTITGSLKAFLPHRAGTHSIICLEAKDKNGSPVFTEYIGAMLRGVECGHGGVTGSIPDVPINEKQADNAIWDSVIHIDPLRPYVYDGCTNIEFPIHTSPHFAEAVGLPGIILQGTATLAYAVREIVNIEADEDPEKISEIACNFTGMVRPGTDIKVICNGKKVCQDHTDLFFEVLNNKQEKAIRNGYIKIKGGKNGSQ